MSFLSIGQGFLVAMSGGIAGALLLAVPVMFLRGWFLIHAIPDGSPGYGEGMELLLILLVLAPVGFCGGLFIALIFWFRSPLGREDDR